MNTFSQDASATTPQLCPRRHRPRREWMRAVTAIRCLIADPKRTDQVFEIIHALTGDSLEPTYQAFVRDPKASALLVSRPRLIDRLNDRAALERMQPGSLGREYLRFVQGAGINADGLVEAQGDARVHDESHHLPLDADREYIAERIRDMHDLWHVLTGYGSDEAGEITNLWFSVGQLGNPGMAFIALVGTLKGPRSWAWLRYNYRAFTRGRRAVRLVNAPFEQLLELPIEEVRHRLNIAPLEQVHPSGIYRARVTDGGELEGFLVPLTDLSAAH